MKKLDTESRKAAISRLVEELYRAVGNSPQGLTETELDDCWKQAKEQWNIRG